MKDKKMKCVVAHPMQQHSYKTAGYLHEHDMLQCYFTSVYYDEKVWIFRLLKKVLGDNNIQRMLGKHMENENIPVQSYCRMLGLLYLLLIRIDKKKVLSPLVYRILVQRFGKKVAKYCLKSNTDCVIMCDTTADSCFKRIKVKNPRIRCVLDMSSIPTGEIIDILENEKKNNNPFINTVGLRLKSAQSNLRGSISEMQKSDVCLVPSSYVKSIVNRRAPSLKTIMLPYGVVLDEFTYKETCVDPTRPLKFLYVGGIEATKGSYYVLEAFKSIDKCNAELLCVGDMSYAINEAISYRDVADFMGFVVRKNMPSVYAAVDVYIIPSLYEGLSQSTLEAMSSGLPVISTICCQDLVCNGENGYIVKTSDCQSIIEAVNYFVSHREKVAKMGKRSREIAQQFSWDRYGENLVKAVQGIVVDYEENFDI